MENKLYADFNKITDDQNGFLDEVISLYFENNRKMEDLNLYISATKNDILNPGFTNKIAPILEKLKKSGIYMPRVHIALNMNQAGEKLIKNVENDSYYYTPTQWQKIEAIAKYISSKDANFVFDDLLASFSLIEAEVATRKISNVAKIIKKENNSPFEKLLTAYRVVTQKKYVRAEQDDDYGVSRSPYSTQISKTIVCVGYSLWLKAIIEELGEENIRVYENHVAISEDNQKVNGFHSNVIVYIKDPKYGIDGYYYLDPTWDSVKKNAPEGVQLLSYFMVPLKDINFINKHVRNATLAKNELTCSSDNFLSLSNIVRLYNPEENRIDFTSDSLLANDKFLDDLFKKEPGLAEQICKDYSKFAQGRPENERKEYEKKLEIINDLRSALISNGVCYLNNVDKTALVFALNKPNDITMLKNITDKIKSKHKSNKTANKKYFLETVLNKDFDDEIKLYFKKVTAFLNKNKPAFNALVFELEPSNIKVLVNIMQKDFEKFVQSGKTVKALNVEDYIDSFLQQNRRLEKFDIDEAINEFKSKKEQEINNAIEAAKHSKISKDRKYFNEKAKKIVKNNKYAQDLISKYLLSKSKPLETDKISDALAAMYDSKAFKTPIDIKYTLWINKKIASICYSDGAENAFYIESTKE